MLQGRCSYNVCRGSVGRRMSTARLIAATTWDEFSCIFFIGLLQRTTRLSVLRFKNTYTKRYKIYVWERSIGADCTLLKATCKRTQKCISTCCCRQWKKMKRNLMFHTIVKPCLHLSYELVRWPFFNQGWPLNTGLSAKSLLHFI